MADKKNRYITVAYKLYSDNEQGIHEIFEEAPEAHPFQFITGLSAALPAFEAQVADLNEGDSFDFTLSVEEAFGPYEEEHVIEVPKEMFHVDGRFDKTQIYPGAILPLVNEEGMRFEGLVLDVKESTVKLDLNHPLAGRDLHYVGKVVTARDATPEEIQGMINMMSGEGCGCGHDHGDDHECCGGHGHHHHGDDHECCGGHGHHHHGDDHECCGGHGHHHHDHDHDHGHGEGGCACGGRLSEIQLFSCRSAARLR